MAQLRARIKIVGERPLLWHHFGPDALPLEKRERRGTAGNDPSEWSRTVLMTSDRQLYLEPTYVFGTLRDGAKHTREKRGTLQQFVVATLRVVDSRILVDRWVPKDIDKLLQQEDQPVYLDIRSVCNPATRARNIRYRVAASAGWTAEFTIDWDNTVVSREQMHSVAVDAGKFVGLGDARKIGFGRFSVISFEVFEPNNNKVSDASPTGARKPAKAASAR